MLEGLGLSNVMMTSNDDNGGDDGNDDGRNTGISNVY